MKKKHFPVILFSSSIVIVVFLSTLFGYSLYTQFKKDAFTAGYWDSIYAISADIFREDIVLTNTNVKTDESGEEAPVVTGTIRNNSERQITNVLIEFSFSEQDGRVLYKEWVRPLAGQSFDGVRFFTDPVSGEEVISPGGSFNFRHVMRNCPKNVIRRIPTKRGFGRKDGSRKIEFKSSVGALKIL
jgi:hypothetical protein